MHERGRGDGEESHATSESEIAQQEVQLRRKERADDAEHGEDTRAAGDRERDDRQERKAEVADRVDRVADDDAVDVGELLRVEREVARARVVVREIEVLIEDEALRDDEVVGLDAVGTTVRS